MATHHIKDSACARRIADVVETVFIFPTPALGFLLLRAFKKTVELRNKLICRCFHTWTILFWNRWFALNQRVYLPLACFVFTLFKADQSTRPHWALLTSVLHCLMHAGHALHCGRQTTSSRRYCCCCMCVHERGWCVNPLFVNRPLHALSYSLP